MESQSLQKQFYIDLKFLYEHFKIPEQENPTDFETCGMARLYVSHVREKIGKKYGIQKAELALGIVGEVVKKIIESSRPNDRIFIKRPSYCRTEGKEDLMKLEDISKMFRDKLFLFDDESIHELRNCGACDEYLFRKTRLL